MILPVTSNDTSVPRRVMFTWFGDNNKPSNVFAVTLVVCIKFALAFPVTANVACTVTLPVKVAPDKSALDAIWPACVLAFDCSATISVDCVAALAVRADSADA